MSRRRHGFMVLSRQPGDEHGRECGTNSAPESAVTQRNQDPQETGEPGKRILVNGEVYKHTVNEAVTWIAQETWQRRFGARHLILRCELRFTLSVNI